MPKTYTLLVTLTGREPADLTALAERIRADLETGTAAGAPYESAVVDAFDGDCTHPRYLPREGFDARRLHRNLRDEV
jgi:hypothetical protein